MCYLRVVLFVKGRGSDPYSYRPHRDETQWWGRRDALVRCVASFMFGPRSTGPLPYRELVLLFDEDWARIEMWLSGDLSKEPMVPTERNIIAIWKEAATGPEGSTISRGGLNCRIVRSREAEVKTAHGGMSSKREMVRHLQANCSTEFLRSHGLNSSEEVVLRKQNRTSLTKVWNDWEISKVSRKRSSNTVASLQSIIADLLQPIDSTVEDIIAGTLHESHESELPYWQTILQPEGKVQACLFLGAVRDMDEKESECLRSACIERGVALVSFRLGPVAEFTSKILTVVAFHQEHGVLWPALKSLYKRSIKLQKLEAKKLSISISSSTSNDHLHSLDFILFAQVESTALSLDLGARTQHSWCLVRCVVNALWRSHLAGSRMESPLMNRLIIVFRDGLHLQLDQDEFVRSLAERHQAAPSEYQILSLLQSKIRLLAESDVWSQDTAALLLGDRTDRTILVLSTTKSLHDTPIDLSQRFYTQTDYNNSQSKWRIIVSLVNDPMDDARSSEYLQFLLRACRRLKISTKCVHLFSAPCQDREGATITLLQHFAYQRRLVDMLTGKSHDRKRKK